jgi:hypothetical protein
LKPTQGYSQIALKLSQLLSLTLSAAGGLAAQRILEKRHAWEQTHNRVAICADFEDVNWAAIRAGKPLDEVLHELGHHGATHISLPELTLNRLRASGQLTSQAPSQPLRTLPPVGHWNYLRGAPTLVSQLAEELRARLPYTEAQTIGAGTLAFAGDLPSVGEMGLGFDADLARRMNANGLACVPRPVSYAWPEDKLIELTLAQAAVFGKLIAFDGDMILGHEMHLEATLGAMEREGLSLVYFAESRHQKGDWFVAKRRAPQVVLAHRYTAQEMVPLDFHAAAHTWAHFARERGIRLCYVNFFKVLHATEPLEGLHYIEHIKEALEHDGFVVSQEVGVPQPVPQPDKQELALVGLASAGAAASAVNATLRLPEVVAVPLTLAAAGGAAALPYLEKARGHLEEHYPPSYAPKLLALASAALAPVAAVQGTAQNGAAGWAAGLVTQAASAANLAAVTSGPDYHLRIEEFKGFNLDWALPLASAALTISNNQLRFAALAGILAAWRLANQRGLDPLAQFDPAHAEGHTHHLSAAARFLGDAQIALGPKPARKWAGLGAAGTSLSLILPKEIAPLAAAVGALGSALGLVGFRRAERSITLTGREALQSFGVGIGAGVLALLLSNQPETEEESE